MPTPQRQPGAGLIDALLAEPQRFGFFQAVRLLEQWLASAAPGSQPLRLRYRNRLSLAFPPGETDSVTQVDGHLDITPSFMGLLGSSGALPHHYTERIAAHEQREQDDGPRAFLDLLSHRALAMFCQAWATHRPECMRDGEGGDGYLAKLLMLAGAPPPLDGAICRESFARYAVQVSRRTVSHDVMTGMLTEYFGVPVKVEPLIGVWETLPLAQQAQLGLCHCGLRQGVLLGERLHRCDTLARIRIGPLDKAGFERFLPRGAGAVALQAMLAMFSTGGIAFEIRLRLRAPAAHGFSLHPSVAEGGARLGVSAFLLAAPSPCDREDASYLMRT